MAKKEFLFLWGRSEAQPFVLHVEHRRRGPEVISDHSISWADLNFGQEPVLLEASVFKLFPEKLFSNY